MANYREFDDLANLNGNSNFQSDASFLQNISNDIQLFNKNVSTLEKRLALLGTPQDTSSLRHEIIDMVGDTVQLAKMASTSIEKVKAKTRSLSQPEKVQFERLVSSFKASLSKFQKIQSTTTDLEKEMLTKARSASIQKHTSDYLPESEREGSGLRHYEVADRHFSAQRQAQLQDTADLEEREREMHQLEHDILDINDIFRDLGTMVHEQGEAIDNIESNVETAAVRVESGNRQLESAVRHKRCSRKLICVITGVIIGVVIAIIIIAIILVCSVPPGTSTCSRS